MAAVIGSPTQADAHAGKTDPFASIEIVENQADRPLSPVVIIVAPRNASSLLSGGPEAWTLYVSSDNACDGSN